MAIFDKIGETISSKSKIVAKKAKDFAEVTSLNSQISTSEDVINGVYCEIGKKYFEQNKDNDSDQFIDQFHKIFAAQENIEQLKIRIEQIKDVRSCPYCGAEIQTSAQFCPSCGTKIETAPLQPDITAKPAPLEKVCAKCGAKLPEGSAFCVTCGTKVETDSSKPDILAKPAPEEKVCAKCGAKLPEGSAFCVICGTKVEN